MSENNRVIEILRSYIKRGGTGLEETVYSVLDLYTEDRSEELVQDLAFMVRECVDTTGRELEEQAKQIVGFINLKNPEPRKRTILSLPRAHERIYCSAKLLEADKVNNNGRIYDRDLFQAFYMNQWVAKDHMVFSHTSKLWDKATGFDPSLPPPPPCPRLYQGIVDYIRPTNILDIPNLLGGDFNQPVFNKKQAVYREGEWSLIQCSPDSRTYSSITISSETRASNNYLTEVNYEDFAHSRMAGEMRQEEGLALLSLLKSLARTNHEYDCPGDPGKFIECAITSAQLVTARRAEDPIIFCSEELYHHYRYRLMEGERRGRLLHFTPRELLIPVKGFQKTDELVAISNLERGAIEVLRETVKEAKVEENNACYSNKTYLKLFVNPAKLEVTVFNRSERR